MDERDECRAYHEARDNCWQACCITVQASGVGCTVALEACTAHAITHAGGYTTAMTVRIARHGVQMDGWLPFWFVIAARPKTGNLDVPPQRLRMHAESLYPRHHRVFVASCKANYNEETCLHRSFQCTSLLGRVVAACVLVPHEIDRQCRVRLLQSTFRIRQCGGSLTTRAQTQRSRTLAAGKAQRYTR